MTVDGSGLETAGAGSSGRSNGESAEEFVSRVGPIEVDWPRSLGYFGGVATAVAVGIIEPPLGLFIVAIPLLKMLKANRLPTPAQFLGHVLDGVAKRPVTFAGSVVRA